MLADKNEGKQMKFWVTKIGEPNLRFETYRWGMEWTRNWEGEYSGDTRAIKNWEIWRENDKDLNKLSEDNAVISRYLSFYLYVIVESEI